MTRPQPVRTCAGCRVRATKSGLLRVVVAGGGAAAALVPDERGTRTGRGAYLHLDPRCLDLAERRRALPRALRHEGPLDASALRAWVDTQHRISSNEEQTSETDLLDAQHREWSTSS